MYSEEGGDFALAETLEIVKDQAFVLPGGEMMGHYFPHLAHLRADKARPLLSSLFLVAVVAGDGRGKYSLKDGGIVARALGCARAVLTRGAAARLAYGALAQRPDFPSAFLTLLPVKF